MIMTIPELLENSLASFSDKSMVVQDDRTISFSDFYRKSLITSHILKDLGVRKGDRVGVCMGKSIDQALVIVGIMYANAVFVPILPNLKHSNIQHIIQDSGMKAMITDSSRLDEVKAFEDEVKIIIGSGSTDDNFPALPYMRRHCETVECYFDCISRDNAAIIYSSGSTGRPKGIVISHRNLFDGARIVSSYTKTASDDRIAGLLSFNFDYGLNQLWQTIYKGATLYLHDLRFPRDLFDLLDKEKITSLPLMPVIMTRMFDPRFYKPCPEHDYSSMRFITTSGGLVSKKMLGNLEQTFPTAKIYLMYGLTEAFRSSYLPPDQLRHRPKSIGKAIPDVELLVMDDDMNVCPPGVPGQLVHRGGCMSKGYWNDPEKTAKCFREIPAYPGEKVLFTGDTVRQDEEGYLYFISRRDSMIKTHGFRVSPTEIEEEAVHHDEITAAVAFGIPNIEIGNDIVLAYETVSKEPLNNKLLLNFLKQVLPTHMVPRHLIHFKQFPSTGNEGKIDRVFVIAESKNTLGITADGASEDFN